MADTPDAAPKPEVREVYVDLHQRVHDGLKTGQERVLIEESEKKGRRIFQLTVRPHVKRWKTDKCFRQDMQLRAAEIGRQLSRKVGAPKEVTAKEFHEVARAVMLAAIDKQCLDPDTEKRLLERLQGRSDKDRERVLELIGALATKDVCGKFAEDKPDGTTTVPDEDELGDVPNHA